MAIKKTTEARLEFVRENGHPGLGAKWIVGGDRIRLMQDDSTIELSPAQLRALVGSSREILADLECGK